MDRSYFVVALFVVSLCHSIGALSKDFFVVVSGGQSDWDVTEQDYPYYPDGSTSGGKLDKKDSILKFSFGIWINENFGIDLGYVDLGETKYSIVSDGSAGLYDAGTLRFSTDVDGVLLGLNVRAPVTEWVSIRAKLGVFRWDAVAERSVPQSGRIYTASAQDDGNDPFYGIGFAADISPALSFRVDLERYEVDGTTADVTFAGFEFNF